MPKPPIDDGTVPIHDGRGVVRAVTLVVDAGGAKIASYRLASGVCIAGSATGCDLVVPDRAVSRQHVEFGLLPTGVTVRDLGSRNGTFYLGQRIERMVLAPGSRVEIGAVSIRIDADADAVEIAPSPRSEYRGLIGRSLAMRRLFATLERLEGSLAPVLVTGESGSGKELVARAIHDGSKVESGPLVTVNCGAFPRDLVASELFGHKRGAFTGATENRKGAFDAAEGGTLFLDEIGEFPIDVQPMLLRALEAKEIRAVGDDRARKVDVRVIAATNRDLEEEVGAGRFREDLFFRLAIIRVEVPPLRARPDDIAVLAAAFAERAGIPPLAPELVADLQHRPWVGNVRELWNAVQTYAALGRVPAPRQQRALGLEPGFDELVDFSRSYLDQKDELVDRFTRVYLKALLAHARGNQSAAARIAGIDRTYLARLMAKLGVERP